MFTRNKKDERLVIFIYNEDKDRNFQYQRRNIRLLINKREGEIFPIISFFFFHTNQKELNYQS